MLSLALKNAVPAMVLLVAATGAARADCESDMVQMEQAYKSPALTAAGKSALDAAKPVAVAGLNRDDDAGCHTAIAEAMIQAGIGLK